MTTAKNTARNLCIIAHIDHGKSTLADRFLEYTKTVAPRDLKEQVLDSMDLERERGITIKLQPVRMQWKNSIINLIDTPGHLDFSYEVSRSLASVEGALLLVDATQGIQAQTLSNLYLALDQKLIIIPVINKIDLPAADVARVERQLLSLMGCSASDIVHVSAKTGEGVSTLLDTITERIPPAYEVQHDNETRCLIFDAQYNEFKGIVIFVRVFSGSVKSGDKLRLVKSGITADVIEVGYFTPSMQPTHVLGAGDIGYIITNIKSLDQTRIGDTITAASSTVEALPGYKEVSPMVYASVFPADASEYERFRKAVFRLKLNDSSITVTPFRSDVLGYGYQCGFLGLLHMEIFQERILREHGVRIVITAPTVAFRVTLQNDQQTIITTPSSLPDPSSIKHIEQPMVRVDLITPVQFFGPIMEYTARRGGQYISTEYIDDGRALLHYRLPLSKVIAEFYDSVKNISSGYASYTYDVSGYEVADIVRLDFVLADEVNHSLSMLVERQDAESLARAILQKLSTLIPRAQFVIKLQARIGGKIIASEKISALRKDVTAKLYGGDVTRKRKLLEKQKKGKKRMASHGQIEIPQSAYIQLLRRD